MFFTFWRFGGHFTNHTGQKLSPSYRKSNKNGVGRDHFCDLFGPFWTPAWAHLGPNWPIWSHHMVYCGSGCKKYIKNVEISCFSTIRQNRAKKPLFAIISVIYFRGRLLRLLHLLLQFSTDLDNSFCILFTIGWTSYLLLRILNFCPKTKWRPLDFGISKKKICQLSGGAILVWDRNSKFWATKR